MRVIIAPPRSSVIIFSSDSGLDSQKPLNIARETRLSGGIGGKEYLVRVSRKINSLIKIGQIISALRRPSARGPLDKRMRG